MPSMQEWSTRMQANLQMRRALHVARQQLKMGLRRGAYYDAGMPHRPKYSDKCNRTHRELASHVAGQTGEERMHWGA